MTPLCAHSALIDTAAVFIFVERYKLVIVATALFSSILLRWVGIFLLIYKKQK